MRQKVAIFVESCDTCLKIKPANRKEFAVKILISGIFHAWCVDFAEPLPRTNVGNQYLIVPVEKISKWPVAWTIPSDLSNSLVVMEPVKKGIIMLFCPLQYILGYNELNCYFKAVQDFTNRLDIQWQCTSTFDHQDNALAERMDGTFKKALQNVTQSESKEWDTFLETAFYVYRHRLRPDGVPLFEILFGVKPRFAIKSSGAMPGEEVLANARPFQLSLELINHAERLVPRTFQKEAQY